MLGNLPRSRPGRRSDKRAAGGAARKPADAKGVPPKRSSAAASRAKRSAGGARKPAAARPSTGTPSRSSAASRSRSSQPAEQRPRSSGGGDPITQTIRIAGKVAEAGVKTVAGIVKRLPGR